MLIEFRRDMPRHAGAVITVIGNVLISARAIIADPPVRTHVDL